MSRFVYGTVHFPVANYYSYKSWFVAMVSEQTDTKLPYYSIICKSQFVAMVSEQLAIQLVYLPSS